MPNIRIKTLGLAIVAATILLMPIPSPDSFAGVPPHPPKPPRPGPGSKPPGKRGASNESVAGKNLEGGHLSHPPHSPHPPDHHPKCKDSHGNTTKCK